MLLPFLLSGEDGRLVYWKSKKINDIITIEDEGRGNLLSQSSNYIFTKEPALR